MMSPPRKSRIWRVGIACSLISGAWAFFWLVAIAIGDFPGSFRSYFGVLGFTILAVAFRSLNRIDSKVAPFVLWPCLPLALGIVSEARAQHQLETFAIAAFATCI